jgi:hypothetical protein
MLSLKSLSCVLTFTLLLACAAKAQSGSASVRFGGHVSGTVLLSVSPTAQLSDQETLVAANNLDAHTILVSIKTYGSHAGRISIPLQIRSNVGYTLSASARGSETWLRGLRVTGARATGRFVAADAVEAMNVATAFDARTLASPAQRASLGALQLFPSPFTLLAGPRISLAGPSDSPHNAVEVLILAEVEASAEGESQSIELVLSASPDIARASSPALAQK